VEENMSDKCPNKKICGSCEWSEIPYQEQVSRKLKEINRYFEQNGFDYRVGDIKSSPKTSHYRNRMDFVIDYQGNFGLREKGKWWKVIDNHTCFIADEKIEETFHRCYEWVKKCGLSCLDRKTHKGLLSYIVLRCSTLGELMINVVTSPDFLEKDKGAIEKNFKELDEKICPVDKSTATTLVWSINHSKSDISSGDEIKIISGKGFIEEEINGIRYVIAPNTFFQTNSLSAANLQEIVMKFAGKIKAKNILDLYCGSGFFTIPLSKIGNQTTGVEIIEEAVDTAKRNAKKNNALTNKSQAEFICEKSEDLSWQNTPADLIVLDPPRAGLHKNVIRTLKEKKAKNIIYVSCNFRNFVNELKIFSTNYIISESVAIDMFPHTHHVELVTLMTLR
jgi:23S rRNA (uracil-5-)-methyltransferase RumA